MLNNFKKEAKNLLLHKDYIFIDGEDCCHIYDTINFSNIKNIENTGFITLI
jgi:hypothetical protein